MQILQPRNGAQRVVVLTMSSLLCVLCPLLAVGGGGTVVVSDGGTSLQLTAPMGTNLTDGTSYNAIGNVTVARTLNTNNPPPKWTNIVTSVYLSCWIKDLNGIVYTTATSITGITFADDDTANGTFSGNITASLSPNKTTPGPYNFSAVALTPSNNFTDATDTNKNGVVPKQ